MPVSSPRADRTLAHIAKGIAARTSTHVTLPADLVAAASELGVNISQAAESGIAAAVARSRRELRLAEDLNALRSSNACVEEHGLPPERSRSS